VIISSALPVLIVPALKVNVESRILFWQSAFCGKIIKRRNAMARDFNNILPLEDDIFQK
jgi:hypothetical protein